MTMKQKKINIIEINIDNIDKKNIFHYFLIFPKKSSEILNKYIY